jgi:hypothetical protein
METTMNEVKSKEEKKKNQCQRILEVLKDVTVFPSTEGDIFLEFYTSGHKETWPIDSTSVLRFLQSRYYEEYQDLPENKNVEKAISLLKFRAKGSGVEKVHRRIGRKGGHIYLDLGSEAHNFIEVDGEGWRVVSSCPLKFTRAGNTMPLPIPEAGGDIQDFKNFLNLESESDFVLILSYMIGSLYEGKEYPILILQGPQGSAKTTTSTMIKDLVDPGKPVLRSLPKQKEEELFIIGQNCHLICFDNLSGLTAAMSDSLCKISTGCGISFRKLYTNGEEFFIELSRPMIINGIDDLTSRPDLADRSIVLHLPKLSEKSRIQSSKINSDFEKSKSRLLGSLLDGLSHCLKIRETIHLNEKPRMADFCITACAALEKFGYSRERTLSVFMGNRHDVAIDAIEQNTVGRAIVSFAKTHLLWKGTPSEFLEVLGNELSDSEQRSSFWPKTPSILSREINRIAPALRSHQIEIVSSRTAKGREISLHKLEKDSSLPSHPSSPIQMAFSSKVMKPQDDAMSAMTAESQRGVENELL